MFGYEVAIAKYCTNSQYSDEAFGDWSEVWSNTFTSVSRLGADQEPNYWDNEKITSDLDIAVGERCHVVWVEYSTGDSFGYSSYGGVMPIAIFKDEAAAISMAEDIRAEKYGSAEKYLHIYSALDGQEIKLYAGTWTGHFEQLENVNVSSTIMQEESLRTRSY